LALALQLLINGISLGMIYGLIAIGYTMVYGIIGMINFAHGDMLMISAFLAMIAMLGLTAAGIASPPVVLILMLIFSAGLAALFGWTIERVAYRPLRGSFRLAPLISAIGMSIVLENYVQVAQGPQYKTVPAVIEGGFPLAQIGDFTVQVEWMQILIVVTTLAVLFAFTWLVTKTPLGRSMRAVEQDRKMASLLGIDTDRTISLTFVIGAALAAVAGMFYLLKYHTMHFDDGFIVGLKAFAAAVLGGIGSLPGAVLGGLLIGMIEVFWAGYASVEYTKIATFSVLILVLMFKPTGILGRADVEKV
jgi:branched-chain amino acid transport system permease protein